MVGRACSDGPILAPQMYGDRAGLHDQVQKSLKRVWLKPVGQRVAARRAKRSPSSIISFGEALWQKVSNIAVSATVKRPEHATASASKKSF